jgi:hypothetical protein
MRQEHAVQPRVIEVEPPTQQMREPMVHADGRARQHPTGEHSRRKRRAPAATFARLFEQPRECAADRAGGGQRCLKRRLR